MKNKKKPRKTFIYATTVGVVDNISLSHDPKKNSISFETEVKDTYSEVSYNRAKGPKIISLTPQKSVDLLFNHNEFIHKNFRIVFAVDTNTQIIKGNKISVTGIVQAQRVYAIDKDGVAKDFWQFFTPFCIELMEVQQQPENLGWTLVIKYIQSNSRFNDFDKIGIVVDSDLEYINKFNSQKKPVFQNFYLPERFQLIYASADTGKEFFANQMLSYADKASSRCLQALKTGIIPINSNKDKNEFYTAIRHIYSKLK